MTKLRKYSQKTTKRPRRKSTEADLNPLLVASTNQTYYRSWSAIRHLCKRDGYFIYLTESCYNTLLQGEKTKQAIEDLKLLGFSFQITAFLP